jgi:aspartate-semialdehyde dehydrogenase
MPVERDSHRIIIAGASSLLGVELKTLLEQSRFAASEFTLLDEELAAGTLTEAGGEPAVIQPVQEDSFDRARFIFLTGSPEFTQANLALARRTDAVIIDLSGYAASLPEANAWLHNFAALRRQALTEKSRLVTIPSAPAEALVRLTLGLQALELRSINATVLQSVSAWGKTGIEELETQATHLLGLQTAGTQWFDAQLAFNTLSCFGPSSRFALSRALTILRAEMHSCWRGDVIFPAVQLIHVPVFYGVTFCACAELASSVDAASIQSACKDAGISVLPAPDGPNNVSIAEGTTIQLAQPQPDPAKPGTWWFWGAADNIRLPAWNAAKLAEKLFESLE